MEGSEAVSHGVSGAMTYLASHRKPVTVRCSLKNYWRKGISAMSTINTQVVLNAVRDVEKERLAKAVCGLADGTLTVQVTGQSPTEVKGFVSNGKQYAVTLTTDRAFCSCPDAMFRHSTCKHAVALALHVLRVPQAEVEEEPEVQRPFNLKLGKVRPHWHACA